MATDEASTTPTATLVIPRGVGGDGGEQIREDLEAAGYVLEIERATEHNLTLTVYGPEGAPDPADVQTDFG